MCKGMKWTCSIRNAGYLCLKRLKVMKNEDLKFFNDKDLKEFRELPHSDDQYTSDCVPAKEKPAEPVKRPKGFGVKFRREAPYWLRYLRYMLKCLIWLIFPHRIDN